MSYKGWHKINLIFDTRCINCKGMMLAGEDALALSGLGIKHEECPVESRDIPKDETNLVIFDD